MIPPLVMGIVNVTPDSFSDGGRFRAASAAIEHGLRLHAEGADVLDIGGESTRPGAEPVAEQEELDRVIPVIEGLAARCPARLSIDTLKPGVARAAVAAGASVWNDVTGFREPASVAAAAEIAAAWRGRTKRAHGFGVVVMHMQGEPRTMQREPRYEDVCEEVGAFLAERADALSSAGVDEIWVDPGIGFGKTLAHNLALVRGLARLRDRTGRPVVFGASRKSLIAKIDPSATDPGARLGGSIALALAAADGGAGLVRVHDVAATAQALGMWRALRGF